MSEQGPRRNGLGRPGSLKNINWTFFCKKRTSTAVSITCTNLQGLGITVDDLADKKINRVLNLTAEIHILIDKRCTEENFEKFSYSKQIQIHVIKFKTYR